MRVVEHLDVERFGTVLEKEREILGGIRLARRVLLAFTRDAREGGIPGIAGHVEVVRIGAVLEEDSTDGDAVLEDCRMRAAGERGIQDRRPSSGAAGLPGGSGALGENAFHFGPVSAHDRGVNAVAGDLRVLGEEALGRAIVHSMIALAVGMVIPAGELEKRRDTLSWVRPPVSRSSA